MATTKKTTVKKEAKEENPPAGGAPKNSVIKNPRITEKAALLAEKNGYTFDVVAGATKNEIKKVIKAMYKVTPLSVRTVNFPKKKVMPRGNRRGKVGSTGGGRKAYVYLKKGDKIEVL